MKPASLPHIDKHVEVIAAIADVGFGAQLIERQLLGQRRCLIARHVEMKNIRSIRLIDALGSQRHNKIEQHFALRRQQTRKQRRPVRIELIHVIGDDALQQLARVRPGDRHHATIFKQGYFCWLKLGQCIHPTFVILGLDPRTHFVTRIDL